MATIEQIKQLLKDQKDEIVAEITSKIQLQIQDVNDKLAAISERTDENSTYITDHGARIKTLEDEMRKVQDELDDQVNRNLRNNLVIKNVPGDEKSWDETKKVVADLLAELDEHNGDGNKYQALIERAHRHGKNEQSNANGDHHYATKNRTIYARLYNSEDTKYFVKKARLLRVANKRYTISVEQQFTEKLKARRNDAMLERRKLLDDKTISSGFLDYPAKLMVKFTGDTKYKLHSTF